MGIDVPEKDDGDELPDWLKSLQTGSLEAPSTGAADDDAASSDAEETIPDWLDVPVAESSPPPAKTEDSPEDVPDWLQSIRVAEGNTGELPVEAIAEPETPEGEPPAWLSDIREKEGNTGELPAKDLAAFASDAAPGEDAEDVPADWMQSIREQEESSAPADEPIEEEAPASGSFLDRIQELKSEEGLGQDDDSEEDWLSGLGDSDTGSIFVGMGEASEPDAMDWLAIGEDSPAKKPAPNDISANDLTTDGEKPDWLPDDEGLDKSVDDVSSTSPFKTDAKSDVFDAEITDEFIATADSVDDAFPDLPGSTGEGAGDLPSWLDKVETGSLDPGLLSASEVSEQQEELRSAAFAFSPDEEFSLADGDLPSWLSDIEPEEPQIVEETEEDRSPTQPTAETPAFSDFDTGSLDGVIDDLPIDDTNIERAELPSWLQAMRPVGPVTPAETGEHIVAGGEEETIGPLAGLHGVLPAEPAIVQFGDEVTEQNNRLRILDRERHQAKMLHQLVMLEDKVRPMPRRDGFIARKIYKSVTGIIMYTLVFLIMLFNLQISNLPDVYAANASAEQVRNTYDLLDTRLPAGPVLVVFDYEPAYTGEMNAAAGSLILQLAMQNRALVLITTTPAGSALAEEFMIMTRANPEGLANEFQYANLGLITGGASGLLDFAANPRTAAPKTYGDAERSSYWNYPPLNQIFSIRDFAAVVVLADDVEDAQVWAEQIEPLLRDEANPAAGIPLIVVSSAQAETLLYAYTQTVPAQIDGLVSGMKGGAYYEARMARNHIVYRYWDGYGAGLTVGVIIISIGALSGLVGGLFRRRGEEEDV